MTLKNIKDERLLPPDVPTACNYCLYPEGRHTKGQYVNAKFWLVSPDGTAVTRLCDKHAASATEELRKFEPGWVLHNIYHDDFRDRRTHER